MSCSLADGVVLAGSSSRCYALPLGAQGTIKCDVQAVASLRKAFVRDVNFCAPSHVLARRTTVARSASTPEPVGAVSAPGTWCLARVGPAVVDLGAVHAKVCRLVAGVADTCVRVGIGAGTVVNADRSSVAVVSACSTRAGVDWQRTVFAAPPRAAVASVVIDAICAGRVVLAGIGSAVVDVGSAVSACESWATVGASAAPSNTTNKTILAEEIRCNSCRIV
jgi:hypothetical protein